MRTQNDAAYDRTVKAIRRLSKAYGYEYVIGVACNGMPEHLEMQRERVKRKRRKPYRTVIRFQRPTQEATR